jgi:hypothetical protein
VTRLRHEYRTREIVAITEETPAGATVRTRLVVIYDGH